MKVRAFGVILVLSFCAAACSLSGALSSSPATALSGTKWRVVEAGHVAPPAAVRAHPFVTFDATSQRLEGSSGVNKLTGIIDVQGRALRLFRVNSTRQAGPPEAMRFEQELLRALELTSFYRISGSELVLRDRAGKPLARLVAETTAASN